MPVTIELLIKIFKDQAQLIILIELGTILNNKKGAKSPFSFFDFYPK